VAKDNSKVKGRAANKSKIRDSKGRILPGHTLPKTGKKDERVKGVIKYLRQKLGADIPDGILMKLAGSLLSSDEKIFLDSLKVTARLIPMETDRPVVLSPRLQALLISRGYVDVEPYQDSTKAKGDIEDDEDTTTIQAQDLDEAD